MNLNKIADKHKDQPLSKSDFKKVFHLLDKIKTELEATAENSKSKYRQVTHRNQIDNSITQAKKDTLLHEAEKHVLLSHSVVSDLLDAIETVESKWQQIKDIHTNGVI
ncbi:hypothetical protein B5631_004560 [Salmonella enterica subsp. enterica serovar Woodinville]|nr:hypothetical protein [Salmonella enterica]EDS4810744.1 hypothetical protein [Salmonella enterica subsp. enterica serovar Woodinville]EBL6520644.1 hypothetical protein [Salmonella enterica]ECL7668254.1 hypothetical protein [Salmonella enterica]EEH6630288.1 hypothetical protein [Salmonella enterica]